MLVKADRFAAAAAPDADRARCAAVRFACGRAAPPLLLRMFSSLSLPESSSSSSLSSSSSSSAASIHARFAARAASRFERVPPTPPLPSSEPAPAAIEFPPPRLRFAAVPSRASNAERPRLLLGEDATPKPSLAERRPPLPPAPAPALPPLYDGPGAANALNWLPSKKLLGIGTTGRSLATSPVLPCTGIGIGTIPCARCCPGGPTGIAYISGWPGMVWFGSSPGPNGITCIICIIWRPCGVCTCMNCCCCCMGYPPYAGSA
mmetsp:Transcript_24568/g.80228  ORF Transcript_24568/g.80228 Transcript_24568/m.80228 type:complete len:262 (+) Transcript_24568:1491-2276(+)